MYTINPVLLDSPVVLHSAPESGDVIVRETCCEGRSTYALHTVGFVDQLSISEYERAVSHALAYARARRVRAWLILDGESPVLISDQISSHRERRTHAEASRRTSAQ